MKLRFENMQTITPDNLEGLSPVHLEQLKVSGTAYGHQSKTPAETYANKPDQESDSSTPLGAYQQAIKNTKH